MGKKDMNPLILIVEDEQITRTRIAAYFEAEGYRVSESGRTT